MKQTFLLELGLLGKKTWSIGTKPDIDAYEGVTYVLENDVWSIEVGKSTMDTVDEQS